MRMCLWKELTPDACGLQRHSLARYWHQVQVGIHADHISDLSLVLLFCFESWKSFSKAMTVAFCIQPKSTGTAHPHLSFLTRPNSRAVQSSSYLLDAYTYLLCMVLASSLLSCLYNLFNYYSLLMEYSAPCALAAAPFVSSLPSLSLVSEPEVLPSVLVWEALVHG